MSDSTATNTVDLAHEADFALGGMMVRPSTRELVAGGRAELLEPRIMQVLVALARRGGQVVSRDDLIDRCWGGRAVGEDAINRCISAIRKLSEAHGGFLITTVARVGYRLDESALPFAKPALPLLAVLAFDNLSGDPDMAWFSDGVSEEILQTLAQGADVKVIARSSSLQFRGADKAVSRVAAELKTTHILDGSVRRSGTRVRISAHLVECARETTLWSDRFDRDLSDIFVLQDEIAAAVATALKVLFARAAPAEAVNPEAYDLYLKAISPAIADAEARLASIRLLERVTVLAPGFARAWAALATAQAQRLRVDDTGSAYAAIRTQVIEAAERALNLDSRLGLAHQALSRLEPFGHYREREALQNRALADSPNDPDVLSEAASFFDQVGRIREALAYAGQAHDLDPKSSATALRYVRIMGAAGDYEQFVELSERFRALWPDNETLLRNAIVGAAFQGDWARFDDLVASLQTTGRVRRQAEAVAKFGYLLRHRDPDALSTALGRARQNLARTGTAPFDQLVQTCRLGMIEETFDLIDQASFAYIFDPQQRWPGGFAGMNVIFSGIHNDRMMRDTRFPRLCAKLGLCGYWVATDRWPDCAEEGVLAYDFKAECRRLAAA